jgi:hypothetical protein
MELSKEIVLAAENNVEVREYVLTKTDEKYYTGKVESYGKDCLESELKQVDDQISYWELLDVQKFAADKLEELNNKKNHLLSIYTEMKKRG